MLDQVTYTKIIYACAKEARDYLVHKYSNQELVGKCEEATSIIVSKLEQYGIKAEAHWGTCKLDDPSSCSDSQYEPHCYALAHYGRQRAYIDITATQFQWAMAERIPELVILLGSKPYWLYPYQRLNR